MCKVMSKSFLTYVAEDLYKRYGTDFTHLTVVFPNKRAALFLNQELARIARVPIWAPTYTTISELFRSCSKLLIANSIQSISLLHKSYTSITGIDETFDHFFGWGQLLLADFDDIDKNMADAKHLFHNVRDLHELDSIEYLDEDQKRLIMRFFNNFTGDETELRKKFIRLWSNLLNVYEDYRKRLRERGLAYEGMLYRDVVEHGKGVLKGDSHYAFVGFNVLQKVEQRLFDDLKGQGRASFYWDYDYYYTQRADHEAGVYVRQWLNRYPNALDDSNCDLYNQLGKEKKIRFLSSPTENLQACYISSWLREDDRYKDGKRTAVVLCDEHLLPTVIHSIPPEVEMLNVTTGYPLQQTPIASLVTQLIVLQTDGFSKNEHRYKLSFVERILRHPYAQYISSHASELLSRVVTAKQYYIKRDDLTGDDEGFELLFRELPANSIGEVDALLLTEWLAEVTRCVAVGGPNGKDPLFQESVFRMFTTLQQLAKLIADGDLDADLTILRRLITQLVGVTSVPFHGEPARGVQVMGVLETRNLDFDHVLILSCNEGNMPKGVDDASFIPHALRTAYGLTTIDNKVSIYSYYFHALIQRAKDVTIAYNSSSDGLRAGELSRFMLQLMVEWPHSIEKFTLQAGQEPHSASLSPVAKDRHVMAVLNDFSSISPSALSSYLRCQLRFFYSYIVGLRQPEENDADTFSAINFGEIFHRAAELLYEKLLPQRIEVKDLQRLIIECHKQNSPLQSIVRQAIAEEFFHLGREATTHPKLNGLQLLNEEVIKKYLVKLLETDLKVAPLRVIAHEATAYAKVKSKADSPKYELYVGGRMDRVDEVSLGADGQQLRVVDYKTGNKRAKPIKELEEVFNPAKIADCHIDYQLQVMIYSLLVDSFAPDLNPQKKPVSPALLFIQHTSGDDYSPVLSIGERRITDMGALREDFEKGLHRLLDDIFSPTIPFAPNADDTQCGFCPYKVLCGKSADAGKFDS